MLKFVCTLVSKAGASKFFMASSVYWVRPVGGLILQMVPTIHQRFISCESMFISYQSYCLRAREKDSTLCKCICRYIWLLNSILHTQLESSATCVPPEVTPKHQTKNSPRAFLVRLLNNNNNNKKLLLYLHCQLYLITMI